MIPAVLASQVKETLLDYLRTTFAFADPGFERAFFSFLDGPDGIFKGPYVEVRLPFRQAAEGEPVPLDVQPPFRPYAHQLVAFERLTSNDGHQPQHTLVTTGTGSGKTECYLYPVLDHCWRNQGSPGIKAIILYPMNALATDQARRLAKVLWEDERLKGKVSAGLYVGGKGEHGVPDADHLVDQREILRKSPPDILLTNYKMLDFLLLRPEDSGLWQHNGPDTLRFLVLDELHTYDGAQGSDVACLVRRLKDRLATAQGSLCCVGTSATIGKGAASVTPLTEFATKVFGERFGRDTVVVEDRYEAHEALGNHIDIDLAPGPDDIAALDPEAAEGPAPWLADQARLWLGEGVEGPVEASARLCRHSFLRSVMMVLGGEIRRLDALVAALIRVEPTLAALPDNARPLAVQSFLSLVAWARAPAPSAEDPGRTAPFLTSRVQSWVRELRHLVRKFPASLDEPPLFEWADEVDPDAEGQWLPLVRCRECGSDGLGAVQGEGDTALKGDSRRVGETYLHRHRSARYVVLGEQVDGELPTYVCPVCMRFGMDASCRPCGGIDTVLALVERSTSEKHPPRFLARCPECGTDQTLGILGSRAASLTSVAISHIYVSPYNVDPKLLAFTDSVQDASHRAGFFGARTYRFNLRTALQGALAATDDEVPLSELADRVLAVWGDKLTEAKLIATLTPSDLHALQEYKAFSDRGGKGNNKKMLHVVRTRLDWEATREFGLGSVVGRTLERTGCSVAGPDRARLTEAAAALRADIEEKSLITPREPLTAEDVEHFLAGLIDRMRTKGGVFNPLLKRYVEDNGKWFHLLKRQNPLLSRFGSKSVMPRFLHGGPSVPATFDSWRSRPSQQTWYRDWASRSLQVLKSADGINDLYEHALRRLDGAGLVTQVASGKGTAAGLRPSGLLVTADCSTLRCRSCRRSYTLPQAASEAWAERVCVRYRCRGKLEPAPAQEDSYYARVYRSGHLERVFSAEHTGLLERTDRERLEERFKAAEAPDAPNLLVCTPTLELGIDIGDLSAAMVCSVPPATANYLQRVGRAGRTTGNAYCFAMAVERPHDLYFFAEPLEMMAGDVLPPGCFLDAPEMLKRQLVAHAMDAWARQETELRAIPPRVSFCLGDAGKKGFPGRFIRYYEEHGAGLVDAFLGLFDPYVSDGNAVRLRTFGVGDEVPDAVRAAFKSVERERKDLKNLRERLKRRLQEVEADPETSDEPENEVEQLKDSLRQIGRLGLELSKRYPLNVMTDAGVLPNYAFPEPGVKLSALVLGQAKGGDGGGGKGKRKRYAAQEYVRPASSAIRELAPFNTFYAEGRKLKITQIDVGSLARPLTENWRFCDRCDHMRVELDGQSPEPVCPLCQSAGWPDSGQVRTLVHFRRALSLADLLESLTVDDTEDRDEARYRVMDLIPVEQGHMRGARLIDSLPFGFELLQGLVLRQVNFGPQPGSGVLLRVAGEAQPEDGFETCLECGRVKNPDDHGDGALKHAVYCKFKRGNLQEKTASVYLYRQVRSEAIRILLPVSSVEVEETVASFKAALELGFRRKFQGNPGHLLVKPQSEPVDSDGTARRRYLVVYDGVPGGTGYLAELWKHGGGTGFMELLELALEALRSCPCRTAEGKDGCYRCLYAYQSQRDLAIVSRRRAMRLLADILGRKGELQEVPTLSEVELADTLESELERKFLAALRAKCLKEPDWTWTETMHEGKTAWRITTPERVWLIESQVDLGEAEGVAIASRPDFMLRPMRQEDGVLPVAVFCDGFAYHVQPDAPRARLGDDVRKRQAIIDSGRYACWSVTWKDVEVFEGGSGGGGRAPSIFDGLSMKQAGATFQVAGATLPRDVGLLGSMAMLWRYLGKPEQDQWERAAHATAAACLVPPSKLPVGALDRLERRLGDEPARFTPRPAALEEDVPPVLGWVWRSPWALGLVRTKTSDFKAKDLSTARIVLRLFDEQVGRQHPEFEGTWRAVLQAWNLLQFHGADVHVHTTEGLAEGWGVADALMVAEPGAEGGGYQPNLSEALEAELEDVDEACRELARSVMLQTGRAPEPFCEIATPKGRVVAQAELGWVAEKVGVVLEGEGADVQRGATADWSMFEMPATATDVIAALEESK